MNQPLAYVHPGAKIAKNVVIEPFTTIHNNVIIENNKLHHIQSLGNSQCSLTDKECYKCENPELFQELKNCFKTISKNIKLSENTK